MLDTILQYFSAQPNVSLIVHIVAALLGIERAVVAWRRGTPVDWTNVRRGLAAAIYPEGVKVHVTAVAPAPTADGVPSYSGHTLIVNSAPKS